MAANLDPYLWFQTGIYPLSFKAIVLAWYQLHGQVETHTRDAVARKIREEARRRARKK